MKHFPMIVGDSDNKLNIVSIFQKPALMFGLPHYTEKDSVKCTRAQHVLSAQPHGHMADRQDYVSIINEAEQKSVLPTDH